MTKEIKRLQKKSAYVVKETRRILKKYGRKLDAAQMEPLVETYAAFSKALEHGDVTSGEIEFKQLEHLLETDFAFARKSAIREWAESLFVALIIAMFLRTFVLEAFKIPSGSMIPSLLVGDHIFVNKFVYGIRLPFMDYRLVEWGEPERGDVIVFAYPHDPDKDYIKRVIGLPGDHIEVRGQDVFVNGEIVKMSGPEPYSYVDETSGELDHAILRHATLGKAQFDIIYDESRLHPTMEYTVEPRHLFVMGDNRDNSADSRAWGQVPFDNVKGRAIVVWWSHSEHEGIRFGRMGHLID